MSFDHIYNILSHAGGRYTWVIIFSLVAIGIVWDWFDKDEMKQKTDPITGMPLDDTPKSRGFQIFVIILALALLAFLVMGRYPQ